MKRFFYDLHIHSCLSPCGDDDMTVCNIAGMAYIKGLRIAALTDHNTTDNTPAFFIACERQGIIPVAGAEVTTAEEIHLLCLFPTLKSALSFGRELHSRRMPVKNKPDIFGKQQILDEDDNIIGEEPYLLIPATQFTLEEATATALSYGGAAIPAHIDRPTNGILAILGTMPDKPHFDYIELADRANRDKIDIGERHVIVDSDAHYLENINEAENSISLDVDDDADDDAVRAALIAKLRGNT